MDRLSYEGRRRRRRRMKKGGRKKKRRRRMGGLISIKWQTGDLAYGGIKTTPPLEAEDEDGGRAGEQGVACMYAVCGGMINEISLFARKGTCHRYQTVHVSRICPEEIFSTNICCNVFLLKHLSDHLHVSMPLAEQEGRGLCFPPVYGGMRLSSLLFLSNSGSI
jgi:hypothetical protein